MMPRRRKTKTQVYKGPRKSELICYVTMNFVLRNYILALDDIFRFRIFKYIHVYFHVCIYKHYYVCICIYILC